MFKLQFSSSDVTKMRGGECGNTKMFVYEAVGLFNCLVLTLCGHMKDLMFTNCYEMPCKRIILYILLKKR